MQFIPRVTKAAEDDPVTTDRRQKVREAMIHAWTSYDKYAWGFDQLRVCSPSSSPFFLTTIAFDLLTKFASVSHYSLRQRMGRTGLVDWE